MVMLRRAAAALVLICLAWGVLAFGGAYRWASIPLAAGCLAASALAWAGTRGEAHRFGALLAASVLVLAAILLQVVPLSPSAVVSISPQTDEALRALDVSYATSGRRHPLSLHPPDTRAALFMTGAFLALVVAVARLLSAIGSTWITRGIAMLGTVVALAGIVFEAVPGQKVYGFWTPVNENANPFGPFVNPNHFAGWMLMAIPLTLAAVCGELAGSRRRFRDWRDRIVWLATTEASLILLMMSAAALMGVSLMLTGSRAAMAAMLLTLVVLGVFALVRSRNSPARLVAVVMPLAVFLVFSIWTGHEAIVKEIHSTDSPLQNRVNAWEDARAIAARFPLTGTGLNTYGTATLLYQTHDRQWHYAQAHNDYLQLWAEGGVLLALPAFILLATLGTMIVRRLREFRGTDTASWARAGAACGILAIALHELVDFSLQMPGNAALLALLCGIAIHHRPPGRAGHGDRTGVARIDPIESRITILRHS